MSKPKHKTCYYNVNRKSAHDVEPYCEWKLRFVKELPPHIFMVSSKLYSHMCSKCKAYVHESVMS